MAKRETAFESKVADVPSMVTPWGKLQTSREVAPGVWSISIASYGGLYLAQDRVAQMPEEARAYAARWSHGMGAAWWEEDCAIYLPPIVFPDVAAAWNRTSEETFLAAERMAQTLSKRGEISDSGDSLSRAVAACGRVLHGRDES